MHRNFVVLLAASASLFSLSANAQDDDTTQLNRIVIHTTEDSSNTVDVTDADIERLNPADLQDLFASEPSISVGSSLPVSQKLYVQGVEETNLSVSIDGSRQNNKIFHHNATTLIDPALLKAVSIDPASPLRMPVRAHWLARFPMKPWMCRICSCPGASSADFSRGNMTAMATSSPAAPQPMVNPRVLRLWAS